MPKASRDRSLGTFGEKQSSTMQKAIIIQAHVVGLRAEIELNADNLNEHLSKGWRVVQATPCGASVSESGSDGRCGYAAVLVIIEKD